MVTSTRIAKCCGLLAVALLVSCHQADRSGRTSISARPGPSRSVIDPAEFDSHVSPRADFFQYVNGKWIASHPIPADRTNWGVDYELQERSQLDLKAIVEELLPDRSATGTRQKLRDFYMTAMDEAKLEREGIEPLLGELDQIARVDGPEKLTQVVAAMHLVGASPLFGLYVDQDQKKSDQYAVYLSQAGTVLPERDYYLKDDEDSRKIREAYREHLGRMFALLGEAPGTATASARTVLDLEKRLAEKQMSPVELRDPEPQYNKLTRAQLTALAPEFDWDGYFRLIGAADVREVIVCQPEFLKRMNELLKSVSPTQWQAYLRWHLATHAAPRLSDAFVQENFRFFGQTLGGAKELKPRWKRAIEAMDSTMGEALGQIYVEKRFGPEAKQRINELVDNLVAAYGERIRSRDWMSPATKEKALAKLATIQRKLGYPDKWRDYSKLSIQPDSYVRNYFRGREFDLRRRLARLGQPVERTEWFMTPPTVNAYYNPTMNEIVFPAGILQPPFFDAKADDALNYGAIGSVIGHEMTHGFDDQGCKFDANGNLVNWWTAEDKTRFEARARKLVQQFNGYVAIEDLHINGELTLGENIADLGGLAIAYDAYKRSLKGQPAPVIGGLTGEQRFFISYAIGWRDYSRPEQLKVTLRSNEHAPPRFRVVGPLANMPEFHKAFNVKPGDGMYRGAEDRADVW